MKITEISTKDAESIPIGKFTVLVGPNNVGKSQTLKDIHQRMVQGPTARTVIVNALVFERPSRFDDLTEGLQVRDDPQHVGQHVIRGIGSNLTSGTQFSVQLDQLRQQFDNTDNLDFTFGNLSKFQVAYLDAASRLVVAAQGAAHNPHTQPPQNLLQGLFAAEEQVEDQLRAAFKRTFGMDVRLDYSGMTQLMLRVADEFGAIPEDPRKAYKVFRDYQTIDDQGDGFRSFVGVVLSLLLARGRVVLLDEPEAFLHPAQARQLGHWIAEHVSSVRGQVIVATHNANFLGGILSSDQPADIYRLNRQDNRTTYTRIPAKATAGLAKSPLLSSQRVLEAIFFKGVAVCEADADRAVYQTVAVRELNAQDVLFLHAHNKQTIPRVIDLLRMASIPVCAVVDIDILNSDDDLRRMLTSLAVPSHVVETLCDFRKKIAQAIEGESDDAVLKRVEHNVQEFLGQLERGEHGLAGARGALNRLRKESQKWDAVKRDGSTAIPDAAEECAQKILSDATKYGLCIVPVGELESWLDLETRQKSRWVVKALEALHCGKCPQKLKQFVAGAIDYLEAGSGEQSLAADVEDGAAEG